MSRLKKQSWSVAKGRVIGPSQFFIVGIVNVTPDSFYDGGRCFDTDKAVAQALDQLKQGAEIIDIGGESTRPFSRRIEAAEEMERIRPIIRQVLEAHPQAFISIDTYKAEVAEEVLRAGCSIINDVSACRFDPGLKEVLGAFQPGYVLMHSLGRPEEMQKNPRYTDVVDEIRSFFETRMTDLVKAGLPEENIVLDPGIGFGKLLEHNLTILKHIERFFDLGRPIYMGLSNKSMWEKLLGLPSGARKTATQVATALLASRGVALHRVHEVDLTQQTLEIVKNISL